MTPPLEPHTLPSPERLEEVFRLKYGELETTGWAPRMRHRVRHFTPDDVYEATIADLVTPGCKWLDVGCGRDIFPFNKALARQLADCCGLLVGVDPAPTLAENEFVHERVHCMIDEYETEHVYDLVTLRMVAEHVRDPASVIDTIGKCTKPGSQVVIYTVNRFSPVPLITSVVPFALHQPVKRILWRTDKKDTFPTAFQMNTRKRLKEQLGAGGFEEVAFSYLDDCRSFGRFRAGLFCELTLWRMLKKIGLRYPENCLLGIYRKS